MPREVAPSTHLEFRAWFEGMLDSDEMYLTPSAHQIGYPTAFEIPMPARCAPAKAVHDLIMLGSMPAPVRELYGITYSRRRMVARTERRRLHRGERTPQVA